MIHRGVLCLRHASQGGALSVYQIEASIAATHCMASDASATDWPRILHLYDQLVALTGSPVTAMNRAVAVARVHGAQAGLDALDNIRQRSLAQILKTAARAPKVGGAHTSTGWWQVRRPAWVSKISQDFITAFSTGRNLTLWGSTSSAGSWLKRLP